MGEPQSAAILDVRSSADGRFVRAEAGTEITRLWRGPGRGLISHKDSALEDAAPPSVPLEADEVLSKYDVEVGTTVRVLGVDVVPLALERRKDRALVERLWVHAQSGIVYRRELFDAEGGLVGMATVLDMRWGETERAERPDVMHRTVVHSDAPGDAPVSLPYGYRFVRSYRLDADGRPARHWVYSDGLHALSLFRIDGTMKRPERFVRVTLEGGDAWAGPGPGTWVWEGDGATWAVVAEEAGLDPAELLEPLPRGGRSVWARMGSWWARGWHAVTDLF
jgi:hypothetical protein